MESFIHIHMLFIIYSCKKNIKKAELIYYLITDRIPGMDCYIVYGDIDINSPYELKDKYLVLKCGDNYENLCEKTIAMFKTIHTLFPNTNVLKCDDDIVPNINKLVELKTYIERSSTINYLGHKTTVENEYFSEWHFGKCSEDYLNFLPRKINAATYASGPIYYVSAKSIAILAAVSNTNLYFFEDNMVGYILQQHGIVVEHYDTYYDYDEDYPKGCIQNIYKNPHIFIRLQGGLGNQLFQVAAAYELSKKYHRVFVLLYYRDFQPHMTHNKTGDEFLKTIFNYFNYTCYENIDMSNIIKYQEENCFEYNDNIITTNDNYLLEGYFHNKKYTEDSDILNICSNPSLCKQLISMYPFLQSSYFIHVRRGDYVNHPLYAFDTDTYYKKAIAYILEKDPQAKFVIFSDDVEFIKAYSLFHTIHKVIIDERNTLNTFYLMSMCMYGGICSNSTFSGWASKMNTNPNKIIIVPKQWINITDNYEIPFDYTVSL